MKASAPVGASSPGRPREFGGPSAGYLPPLPPSKRPTETRPSRVFMRVEGKPYACLFVKEAALLTAAEPRRNQRVAPQGVGGLKGHNMGIPEAPPAKQPHGRDPRAGQTTQSKEQGPRHSARA